MKIIHVAESAKGGVGTYISELAMLQIGEFGENNVKVIIPDSHLIQVDNLHPICLHPYSRPDRSSTSLLNLARAISTAVDQFRPDVLHVHSTFAGLAARSLYGWRRDRPRIVYCPHGWSFNVQTAPWKRLAAATLERALALFCDRLVAVSRHEAEEARRIGIPAAKIDTVLNGMADAPLQAALPWHDNRLKVMFVGRLDKQKGFDTLIDAVAPLERRVCVRVAGQAVVDGKGGAYASPAVEHLGWARPDTIRSHLAAADLLVAPSRWEAFGLVALEAMRAGRMVIASDVGGLREVVQHDVSGWLVPPDSPSALAQALLKADRRQRERMGENGRQRFLAYFTADRMHRQLLDTYQRCGPAERMLAKPALN